MIRRFVLVSLLLVFCLRSASQSEEAKPLPRIEEIESFLASGPVDFSVRSAITQRMTDNAGKMVDIARTTAFRHASSPQSDQLRIIAVHHNLANEPVRIALGQMVDNRDHIDVLRTDQHCAVTRVTAFEKHVHEQSGECQWKDQVSELQLKGIFHPCFAATVSPHQTAMGRAMDFTQHNFHLDTIRSVMKKGERVHVLSRFRGSSGKCQIATFQARVPIQVTDFVWPDDDVSKAEVIAYTRSVWNAPEGANQTLPTKIYGKRTKESSSCELIAEISWNVGNAVDPSLFNPKTLGKAAPIEGHQFRTPILERKGD